MRQFLSFLVVATSFFCATSLCAQSFEGVHIGDNLSALDALKDSNIGQDKISDYDINYFKLKDNNTLSVMSRKNGTIVYMEKDWASGEAGQKAGFGAFRFGQTTLQDALQAFDASGGRANEDGHIKQLEGNGFEVTQVYNIEGSDQVVAFIFVASGKKMQIFLSQDPSKTGGLSKMLTLEAVVVTTASVLSDISREKLVDQEAKPIQWQDPK